MKCVLLLYRSQWYTECEQIDKNDRVYPHLWGYDILTCEDIDDFTNIKFVS